jgi:hypothetical protein
LHKSGPNALLVSNRYYRETDLREVISGFRSSQNDCLFTRPATARAAACHLGGKDVVQPRENRFRKRTGLAEAESAARNCG